MSFQLTPQADPNKLFLVQSSELEGRLDPFFYKPEFLGLTERIKSLNHRKLKDIALFSKETWNQKSIFTDYFPYIQIGEIDIQTGEILQIENIDINNPPSRAKMIVRNGDIIISTTRPSRGAISKINYQNDTPFIASTGFSVIREINENVVDRNFMFYLLRLNCSLTQMEQRSSGGNYPAITQEELGNILIPIPPLEVQQEIVARMDAAYAAKKQKERQAQELLASIDDYLLSELGIILPPQPENTTASRIFIRNLSDISGGRFDPFYYQQQFMKNEDAINNSKYKTYHLSDCISGTLIKGILPKQEQKEGNNFVVQINSINLDGSIQLNNLLTAKDIFNNCHKLSEGDILVVITGATIGKIAYWKSQEDNYYLGGDIVKFRIKSEIDERFIFSFLRSSVVQTYIKRNITGATNGHLAPFDIKNIPIPLPPLAKQQEIAEHITFIRTQAKQLQLDATQILETAKREIEAMILG
jgi:restriction endonuclease S subunit